MHQLKRSHCGPIEGKFVNTSESTSTNVGLLMQIWKFTLPVSFYPLVSLRRKVKQQIILQLKRAKKFLLHLPDKCAEKASTATHMILHEKA